MDLLRELPSLTITGLGIASVLFIIASGLSIIFGISRVYTLSHGSLYMLGAYTTYSVVTRMPPGPGWFLLGVLAAAVVVGLVGVVIEVTVMRRIYTAPHHLQIIATFGIFLIIRDATTSIWGTTQLVAPPVPGFSSPVTLLGQTFPAYYLVLMAASLVIVGLLAFLFQRTRWGVLLRAAIDDREMVSALGVNQKILFTAVFSLSAGLAGIAGGLDTLRISASLDMDVTLLVDAFAVVVIGGMGSIGGSFVAAIVVGLLTSFGAAYFDQLSMALVSVAMAVVLLLRPQGLFGKPAGGGLEALQGEVVMAAASRHEHLAWGAAAVALLAAPAVLTPYWLAMATEIAIYALLAWTFYLLAGIGGMVSLGHAAFLGIGMYVPALGYQYLGLGMLPALVLAPLAAGLFAAVVGFAAVRLMGIYFGMLSLAVAQILWSLAFQWVEVTNGEMGIIGLWPDPWASNPAVFYLLTLVLCGGGVMLMRHLALSPFGYALRAARDSGRRADAIGLNAFLQRWVAFTVSGALAGLAGVLLVYLKGGAFPSYLDLTTSLDVFIMALLGGLQSMNGPVVGAVFYQLSKNVLQTRFGHWHVLLGALLILVAVFLPRGISGVVADLRTSRGRQARGVAGPAGLARPAGRPER